MSGAVLRVAEAAGLTDLAAQLAGLIETAEGRMHDDARFPIPSLRPAGGFKMDPALIYALTRLESNFDPDAVSSVGARGLMQVMPVTASYMGGDGGAQAERYAHRLHDPATNLAIGQSYVMYLATMDGVNGDLIRLLGSYNAGPTSFARMQAGMPADTDPLLFIESIPNDETRGFVPRALAYAWIYAARLHVPAPSLDALGGGRVAERSRRRRPGGTRDELGRPDALDTGEATVLRCRADAAGEPMPIDPPLPARRHRRAHRLGHARGWPTTPPATPWQRGCRAPATAWRTGRSSATMPG